MASPVSSPTPSTVKLKANESKNSSLLASICKMRKENKYIDLILELDDNSTISAHKVVLASFSEYFERLLGPNMQEGHQDEPIKLHNVDKESVVAIVDYAYNCEIEVTIDNVYSLLETADYLMIKPVVEGCLQFLETALDSTNCFDVLSCAERYDFKTLFAAAKKQITDNFEETRKQTGMFNLPYDMFLSMMKQDSIINATSNLIASSEEQEYAILDTIFSYVTHNSALSKKDTMDLFRTVHVGCISPVWIAGIVEQYQEYLDENNQVKLLLTRHKSKLNSKPRKFPKPCSYWVSREVGTRVNSHASGPSVIKKFDHSKAENKKLGQAYISGMELGFKMFGSLNALSGLVVYYSNGFRYEYGESMHNIPKNDKVSFSLEPNEGIVKIEAYSKTMIYKLLFYTNTGRKIGPFGGDGGSLRTVEPDPNTYPYLARIGGSVVKSTGGGHTKGLTCLTFHFQVFQLHKDDSDPRKKNQEPYLFFGESNGGLDFDADLIDAGFSDDDDDFDNLGERIYLYNRYGFDGEVFGGYDSDLEAYGAMFDF